MNKKLQSIFPVADMIANTFGNNCEVTIHDLSQPRHSVIYVAGNVTGREIGQSFDHLIKQVLLNGEYKNDHADNYIFHTPDGKTIKSSTSLIRDEGNVIGALCINIDITLARQFYQDMTQLYGIEEQPVVSNEVDAPDDVSSIIDNLIDNIMAGADTTDMNRKKAVELIGFMDDKGVFLVKGAIDKVAAKLGVSKVTVYSYLDESKGKK